MVSLSKPARPHIFPPLVQIAQWLSDCDDRGFHHPPFSFNAASAVIEEAAMVACRPAAPYQLDEFRPAGHQLYPLRRKDEA
jgi:hypothetical protein